MRAEPKLLPLEFDVMIEPEIVEVAARTGMAVVRVRGKVTQAFEERTCAQADDRQGLERRLLRYCARPAFALERLREIDAEHLVSESVKPGAGGSVSLILTPLELIERLAALVRPRRAEQGPQLWGCDPAAGCRRPVSLRRPVRVLSCYHGSGDTPRGAPPRRHRHRYYGVLADGLGGTTCVVILARFSGFISMQFPRDDC